MVHFVSMVPILLRVSEGDLMYEEFVLQILSKEEQMKKKQGWQILQLHIVVRERLGLFFVPDH